ncbi:MAG: peptidoglycan-binding protein [Bifidobacteriaceae bacterium]|jgi:peptidoglycan hydrolase-like protein with peptidoglycan-binding domain|nr:peptidoglycan-binding protein [Bifidobacteriaceae bacterium]
MRRAWRVVILALIVGLGGGVAAGLWLAPDPQVDWATPDNTPGMVDVVPRQFDDARSLPVAPHLADEWDALAPMSGVVRKNNCQVGQKLRSGKAPFRLDDQPVLLLALSTPLWRDLDIGVKGADVTAFQKELRRLGWKDVPTDGYYGWVTAAAVKQLWEKVGGNPKQGSLPLSQVVWLPKRKLTVATCPLRIGQQINSGDKLFTVGGGLVSLTVTVPEAARAGERQVVNGDLTAVIPAENQLTDRAFLESFAKNFRFAEWLRDNGTQLTIDSRLVTPLDVVAVPPSALYDLSETTGCVLGEAGPVRVEVVGSELGQSFIRSDSLPTKVAVVPGEDAPPCE